MQHANNANHKRVLAAAAAASIQIFLTFAGQARAALPISDLPFTVINTAPTNMMLTPSVEWPTGVVAAYRDEASNEPGYECPGRDGGIGVCYFESRTYLGYFDPAKCYSYDSDNEYFVPIRTCAGNWSGNYLNWATMHAIDAFRWVLTGGDRYIDTADLTVLEKARHTGEGQYDQFPIKRVRDSDYTGSAVISGTPFTYRVPAVAPSKVSPKSWNALYVRNNIGIVDGPELFKPGVANSNGRVIQISDRADFSANVETYLVRVKVCDPSSPETKTTCTSYGGSSKPTGLIQQNADRMRFGVSSYLLDSDPKRAGGVIRSRLKFVGPDVMVPNGAPVTNTKAEWDENGVFRTHPDAGDPTADSTDCVDSSGTPVACASGVINYLNKFGKTNGYKIKDTLSEMVYEATRYLRNLPPSEQYTEGMSSAMKDGFQIINKWTLDPATVHDRAIQYSCQKTVLVGIADSNNHCDVTVPGNRLIPGAGDNNHCGAHPTSYAGTDTIDITALDNEVGELENNRAKYETKDLGRIFADYGLGTSNAPTDYRRYNTFHAAGLAYWANTQDISETLAGKQTAQTYWVDVRETGSKEPPPGNVLWLAAKYGGFDNKSVPTVRASWDALPSGGGDGVPDNYFTGDRPDKLVASLGSIFQDALVDSLSASAGSISTQKFSSGSGNSSYEVKYNSGEWTGDVTGNTFSINAETGVITETPVWSAQDKLQTLAAGDGWNTNRRILTSTDAFTDGPNGGQTNKGHGVPFRFSSSSPTANLSPTQLAYLGPDVDSRQKLIEYVRGDPSNEGTLFRSRKALLGDIINSQAVYVGAPTERYNEAFNPGYAAFKAKPSVAERTPMIYVGANDGMLHALNASTADPDGGKELWAYIPSFVLSGPGARPNVDGLAARAANGNFRHKYYVDQTPVVRSVDFRNTEGATETGPQWRTILVAGLNKGGRGYYALDVTSAPSDGDTESTLTSKVLWEFTDDAMGFTFGPPIIVKTAKYGWVVIVTSGYNNTYGSESLDRGKGFLYILNARTGELLQRIGTGEGEEATPSGLVFAEAFVPDFSNFTATQVYAGDLSGNLWRFDLSGTPVKYPAPEKIAVLKDASNNTQPVTSAPKIEIDPKGLIRWVFVGTGKLLDAVDLRTDPAATRTQTFYAFKDGTVTAPYADGSLPETVSFPIPRSKMVQLTNPVAGITADSTKPMGWYFDLPGTSGGPNNATERITVSPTANEGVIAWIGTIPGSTADPCEPGGTSNIYATDYATGKTRLENTRSEAIASFSADALVTGLAFVKDELGNIRLIRFVDDLAKKPAIVPGNFAGLLGAPVRLNWREILQ